MTIGTGSPGDFVVNNTDDMVGIRNAVVGSRCLRTDLNPSLGGQLLTLVALPASVESNWVLSEELVNAKAQLQFNRAYSLQFGVGQQLLPIKSILVTASTQAYLGPCAVVGIRAVTLGAGTVTIHDDLNAGASAQLRFTRATAAMVAGTYYPIVSDSDRAAMLFGTGAYVSVPASSAYWLDIIDNPISSTGAVIFCTVARVTATGIVTDVSGQPLVDVTILAVKVIAAGSAGNLEFRGGPTASDTLLYPSIAFGALTVDQIIKFGPVGGGVGINALHATIPTGAIVLVSYSKR